MSTDLTRCEHGAYANECTQCAYARGHAAGKRAGKREGIEAAVAFADRWLIDALRAKRTP